MDLPGIRRFLKALSDGDQLGITWVPVRYTPKKVAETDNAGQLAAHLKGIDDELGKIPGIIADYTQYDADLADAVAKKHAHANAALLASYTQLEVNLADSVAKKHEHANQAVLDTYTQSNANITDAIAKKHEHTNKEILDTYTQTEIDLADAVEKKHAHANAAALDLVSGTNTGDQDLSPYAEISDVNLALSGKSDYRARP